MGGEGIAVAISRRPIVTKEIAAINILIKRAFEVVDWCPNAVVLELRPSVPPRPTCLATLQSAQDICSQKEASSDMRSSLRFVSQMAGVLSLTLVSKHINVFYKGFNVRLICSILFGRARKSYIGPTPSV